MFSFSLTTKIKVLCLLDEDIFFFSSYIDKCTLWLVNFKVFFFGIQFNSLHRENIKLVDYLVSNICCHLFHTVVRFTKQLALIQLLRSTDEKNVLAKTTSPRRTKLRQEKCFLSCEIVRIVFLPEANKFQEPNLFDHTSLTSI